MATPVEPKRTSVEQGLTSRTGCFPPVDPVKVSAEAPAPDLVTKPRDLAHGAYDRHPLTTTLLGAMRELARLTARARELERAVAYLQTTVNDDNGELARLTAENERLRVALEQIMREYPPERDCHRVARDALKEPRT